MNLLAKMGFVLSLTTLCLQLSACCMPQGMLPPTPAEGPKPQPLEAKMATLAGDEVTLAQYQGQVVLVDFWASWCAPCRFAFPYYADIYNRHSTQGFVVAAISIDEDVEQARQFARRYGLPFDILHDSQRQAASAFSVLQIPMTFLLDRQGRVRYVHRGFDASKAARLEEEVMYLLRGG